MGSAKPRPAGQSTSRPLTGIDGPSPGRADGDYGYWLRLQVGLAVAGIVVWVAGVAFDSPFFSGVGTGIMASALALRFLRGRRPGEQPGGDGA